MVKTGLTNAIFLIDGSSFLYRAYYGLRPLQTSKGVPVQATYGFCRAIKKLIDDFDPHFVALVWDSKGPTSRQAIYEPYKATRQAAPSDLSIQKDQIRQFATDVGLFQIEKGGYEADDIIASLVQDLSGQAPIVIVTPDKDLRQLIRDDHVIVFDPFKNEFINEAGFIAKYGFTPEHLLLYHTLLGDPSDNIPGVKGIGKKSASDLAITYGTLQNVYDHLSDIAPARVQTALIEHRTDALLSEQLFKLQYYDFHITVNDVAFDKKNLVHAVPLFEELEFKSLMQQIAGVTHQVSPDQVPSHDWLLHVVTTQEQLDNLVEVLRAAPAFAYDTETSGVEPLRDYLVGISFAVNTKEAYYVPVGHDQLIGQAQLDRQVVLAALKPLFERKDIQKILHHAKFDQLALLHYGVNTQPVVFDTLIAANLLRGAGEKIGLKQISVRYLNEPMQTFKEVIGKHQTFAQVSIAAGARYGAHDALQTYKLYPLLRDNLDAIPSLKKLFYDIELPTSQVLARMELYGILIDQVSLQKLGHELGEALARIEAKITESIAAFVPKRTKLINLNSPKQLEILLFDELGLPVIKKSKEGSRSTDAEVLEQLSKEHPIPALILQYRELYKLKSTYVDPLPTQVNPRTGRIHTTFSQTEVATGRLSSTNPNLQNIPVGSTYGNQIRAAFIAGSGRIFISADYSQIELRVLAQLSKDANLLAAFKQGLDIHTQTAAELFGVEPSQVTSQQRAVGKRINFSIMYGLTAYGLARDLDIGQKEAKTYIDTYFANYPAVAGWMDGVVAQAQIDGFVQTLFGRRRYIPELREKNRTLFEQGRRVAINTPVQGTTADIMKIAMIAIDDEFRRKGLDAHMVLQIHDELLIECAQELEAQVAAIVRQRMEQVVVWEVPLVVALRAGDNWGAVSK